MANTAVSQRQFVHLVRTALNHLYDYAYLENHPLAALIDSASDLDQITRAQRLRRLLLDCIDEIRPDQGRPASEVDRVHAILTYRYVDGLPMDKVAEKRGLGERQAYRELRKGVRAVASLVRDRLPNQGAIEEPATTATEGAQSSQVQLAQAEVARLREAATLEPLPLQGVLDAALDLLAPVTGQAGIPIELAGNGVWPVVIAHRVMLRQALLSLISSALDLVARGQLSISVSHQGNVASIRISGPAPSSKVDEQPQSEQDNVGPAVARTLIEAQGGVLQAGAKEGEWEAVVQLPTVDQTTILVIDDNADLVALFQRYLAGHQVNVVGATNAEQGLQLAEDIQPQLITLDLMMPDQDGWDTLRKLKSSRKTCAIPVVICSVLNEARLAEAMGASDYIAKPVTQADVIRVLTHWLGPLQPTARVS